MDAFARNNDKNASYTRVYHLLKAQALTIIYTTLFHQYYLCDIIISVSCFYLRKQSLMNT